MNRTLVIALAAALLVTSTPAFAQYEKTVVKIQSETGDAYVGDEPNTAEGDTLAHCQPRDHVADPSCAYPKDDNGFVDGATADGELILAATWRHDVCVNRVHSACFHNLNTLMTRFAGRHFITGVGQWEAWFGNFDDHNADGWIQDHMKVDRVSVSTQGDCQTTLSTSDSNGLGSTQGRNTGVSARCISPHGDEWAPWPDLTTKIAAFITPGDYGSDVVNLVFRNNTREPDFYFFPRGQGFEGETNGRYYGPSSNFDHVHADAGVLETIVLEAISAPKDTFDGARTVARDTSKAESLVEVDVYASVDGSVEDLYQDHIVTPLTSVGCDVDYTALGNACPVTLQRVDDSTRIDEDVLALVGSAAGVDQTTGRADNVIFPDLREENMNGDFSKPRLYFDQTLELSSSWSCPNCISNTGTVGEVSGTGDGEHHAWTHMEVSAILGVWQDKNGDGWIGDLDDDAPGDGCPDPWDCGNIDDPNNYNTATNGGEFVGKCGSKDAADAAPNPEGSYYATLTASPSWGAGVYRMNDEREIEDPGANRLRSDGRTMFDPYDDLALDAADGDTNGDGSPIESLILTGPVTVVVTCGSNGAYNSYQRLVLLDGVNRDYDITLTGTTGLGFEFGGVPATERVSDTDVYTSFI